MADEKTWENAVKVIRELLLRHIKLEIAVREYLEEADQQERVSKRKALCKLVGRR